jgi:mono/diheme cytochrome c family protein
MWTLAVLTMTMLSLAGCDATVADRNPAGGELYARYCTSCHGDSGRGDGPVAHVLNPRPADLTQSTLSVAELIERIDGQRVVMAHGPRAMPVWGEIFSAELVSESKARAIVALRLQALTEHVRGLRNSR